MDTDLPTWKITFTALAVVGSILGAIGGVIAFFLTRYWDKSDRDLAIRERAQAAKEADRAKYRDILYESLKWFEGKTQRRSIGIAVVNTSWDEFTEFRPLWIEVFANQAIYLLTGADEKEGKAHEHDNLRRIMEKLVAQRSVLKDDTRDVLVQTIDAKLHGEIGGGLTFTNEQLEEWRIKLKPRPG